MSEILNVNLGHFSAWLKAISGPIVFIKPTLAFQAFRVFGSTHGAQTRRACFCGIWSFHFPWNGTWTLKAWMSFSDRQNWIGRYVISRSVFFIAGHGPFFMAWTFTILDVLDGLNHQFCQCHRRPPGGGHCDVMCTSPQVFPFELCGEKRTSEKPASQLQSTCNFQPKTTRNTGFSGLVLTRSWKEWHI